jgi:hypothetical protein
MPAAVLHGPCQAGQQTPLAAECQEPVHVTVLVIVTASDKKPSHRAHARAVRAAVRAAGLGG